MPDFKKNQKAVARARKAYQKARNEHYRKKLALQRTAKPSSLVELNQKLKASLDKLKAAEVNLAAALDLLNSEFSMEKAVAELDAAFPILFLPVRIETRFMPPEKAVPTHLWVRIYPDDIFVHSHEDELTANEVAFGEDYWKKLVKANRENRSDKEDQKKAAWTLLKNKAGVQRAMWIARATKPENWANNLAVAESDITFPSHPDTKSHDWTRAPRTELMPDRFSVKIYQSNKLVDNVVGRPIPDEVFLGPDPYLAEEAFKKNNQSIEFDSSFAWINDFDEAVKMGLGLKIPLGRKIKTNIPIERLEVTGIQMSSTPGETKERVEELIRSHQFSKGFSFVPQGSPTNNDGKMPSFYSPEEDHLPKGYYDGSELIDLESNKDSAGYNFAEFLGIDTEPLSDINHADMVESRNAKAMNTALYSATLGSFVEEYLDPVIPKTYHDDIRSFFTAYVSASGPLPAFRIGEQPYGIIVGSDLTNWSESPPFYKGVTHTIKQFREHWDGVRRADVAHVGKSNDEETMLDILGLHAGSVSFRQRLGNLPGFLYSTDASDATKNELARKQSYIIKYLDFLGHKRKNKEGFPLISNMYFYDKVNEIAAEMLVDGHMPTINRHLKGISKDKWNYLLWLSNVKTVKDLDMHTITENPPKQVLYLLLRYALLQTLKKASVELYKKQDVVVNPLAMHKSLYNFDSKMNDLYDKEILYAFPSKLGNRNLQINKPMGDHILGLRGNFKETLHLRNTRKALKTLSGLNTATLHKLLSDHIDLCTYRLDAWESGLYHRRMRSLRQKNPKGLYVGAYGWVENLTFESFQAVNVPAKLKSTRSEKVFKSPANAGFVHTPSLNHATAAGVLMAGYVNHTSKDDNNHFAVNISSNRMRRAMHVYQGIRNNQRIEALLGYQFERALHDITTADSSKNLNQYILELREKYPLDDASIPQLGNEAQETISPFSVVDGLKLTKAKPNEIKNLIGNNAHGDLIVEQKSVIEDTLDALNDLLVSEIMFQATQGKTDRTSAFLNSFNFSEIPPEIEVLDTPRSTHISLTNKVTLHLDPGASNPPRWQDLGSPRRISEPGLNHWLGTVLGNPEKYVCEVSQIDPDNLSVRKETINLKELKINPIDLVYMGGEDIEATLREWQYFVLRAYREKQAIAAENKVKVEFEPPGLAAGNESFIQLVPLVRELRKMITVSKPGSALDFMSVISRDPDAPARIEAWDVTEMKSRVEAALNSLKSLINSLRQKAPNSSQPKNEANPATMGELITHFNAKPNPKAYVSNISFTASTLDVLEDFTFSCAKFGVKVTFPELSDRDNSSDVLTLVTSVIGAASSIQNKISRAEAALGKVNNALSADKNVEHLRAAASAVLGDDFIMIPLFKYQNKDVMANALSTSNQSQLLKFVRDKESTTDEMLMESWVDGVARVRENMNRLDRIRLISDAHGNNAIDFVPAQVPHHPKNTWLSLEFPGKDPETGEEFSIAEETICLAVHGSHASNATENQSVLIIDHWREQVPRNKEITGIAYNYNQPNASAPNALILAVEPTGKSKWDWNVINGILDNTLEQAKSRAVEPAQLMKNKALENLLPATLASFDLYDAGVSLDYGIASDALLAYMKTKNFPLYNYFKI